MTRRYEGFQYPEALLILDTFTGEVRSVSVQGEAQSVLQSNPAEVSKAPIPSSVQATSSPPKPTVEASQLQGFDLEVATTYPYPIARAWKSLITEKDPRVQCKLLVDTFTAVLKMLALQVASEYLNTEGVRNALVNQTLARDLRRPLISAWNLVLQRTLPALRDAQVSLFVPEVEKAYKALETKCKDKFLITTQYEDKQGNIQNRTKKLGKIQALISYRNSLAHGFNQSKSRAQREIDTYLPILKEILEEVRFLARYELWHVRSIEGKIEGMRLHGASPNQEYALIDKVDFDPSLSPLFLRNPSTKETLPLFAFFDVDDVSDGGLPDMGQDVLIFEGNTKSTMIYISANGEHIEKASRLEYWKKQLAQKAIDVELLTADTLNYNAIQSACHRVSSSSLETLIQSGKYLRSATIDRKSLQEPLSLFQEGQYNGLVIGGPSGIGKSSLIARSVDQWMEEGHAVAFYRASALSEPDIGRRLLRDLGVSKSFPYIEEFLSVAEPLFVQSNRRLLLVIDAVNEFVGDVEEFVQEIDGLIHQAKGHTWFRVVVSIRDGTQKMLPADAQFGARGLGPYLTVEELVAGESKSVPIVRLQPITEEEVELLYNAYREYRIFDPDDPEDPGVYKFRPDTSFEELEEKGHTRILLREPLLARLVLSAHHRIQLPSNLREDTVMRLYLDMVVCEKTNPNGSFPDRLRFLQLLVKELDRASQDSLSRDKLSAMPAMRQFFGDFQRDSAYVQLLELGVLLEEWSEDECNVRFAFDRVLEFLLAERIDPRIQSSEHIIQLAYRAVHFSRLRGVAKIILGRAFDQKRWLLITELVDSLEEGKYNSDVAYFIQSTIAEMLVHLSVDSPEMLKPSLDKLQEDPSVSDIKVLCHVADELSLLGEMDALALVLSTLDSLSKKVEGVEWRAKVVLWLVWYEYFYNRYDSAEQLIQEILPLLGDELLDYRGRLIARLGTIYYAKSREKESVDCLQEALKIFEQLDNKLQMALIYRRLAISKRTLNPEEAGHLYRSALVIDEELDNKSGIASGYSGLGVLAKNRGDYAEAERLYHLSLDIHKELGDKITISSEYFGLGNLHRKGKNLEKAKEYYYLALKMKEELKDKSAVARIYNSLGSVAFSQNDIGDAEQFYTRSLAIKEELGLLSSANTTRYNLGCLSWNMGDLKKSYMYWAECYSFLQDCTDYELELYVLCKLSLLPQGITEEQLEKMEALFSQMDTSFHRVMVETAKTCMLAKNVTDITILEAQIEKMKKSASSYNGKPDIEDGLVPGLWAAAQALARLGRTDQAIALAREAQTLAGEEFWAGMKGLKEFLLKHTLESGFEP